MSRRLPAILTFAMVFAIAPLASAGSNGDHSRTAVIVLENREFDEVVGSPEAPYFNHMVERGALATNFYGLLHPSMPNYLGLLAGSTFGLTDDCTDCLARGANLATQLGGADVSWRAYMGGMPTSCYEGPDVGEYVKRHNPFMYFRSITERHRLCSRVVPERSLRQDLTDNTLPEFVWIGPGLCNDGHNCSTGTVDDYLQRRVPAILRRLGPDGDLAITFDEGSSDAGCCGVAAGGRIATLFIGPGVKAGVRLSRPYTSYSLLATIEDRFDLPRLRNARDAPALKAALKRSK
jgi:phosphatidylinositol-3-phosphatase